VQSSEGGCFDSFELRGKWWLPDAPNDRVHGTVTYSPAQRITLRLDGKFQQPELQNILTLQPFKAECILGETVEEEFVTLHRTFASEVSRTDTFTANALVTGERFSSASDFLISGALIAYTNLEEWASVRLLKTESGATAESFCVAVPTSAVNLFTVKNTAPFQSLALIAMVQSSLVEGNFSAKLRASFDCDFQRPLFLREAEGIFIKLGYLLSILQGQAAHVSRVGLKISGADGVPRTANLFRVPRIKEPQPLNGNEMNLSLGELSDHATCLFGSWFTNAIVLDPICDLLVGTYGNRTDRTKFLALAQALEGFHRGAYGGAYTSRASYEPIRESLCAAIPADLDEDFRRKLKDTMKYGFQYSLRTRLKALLSNLTERTKEAVVQEKMSNFIDRIVQVRNYLTHFDETEKPAIVDDLESMYNLNQRFRALSIILLLKYLGVPEDKVTNGVTSHLGLAR
jgi:hypothetical protein